MDTISNDKNADQRSDNDAKGLETKGPEGSRRVAMIDNCIQSTDLFASGREITIAHGTDTYRLRLTSQNKLILTK